MTEHEELLKLRALMQEQQQKLARQEEAPEAKDKIIEARNQIIEKQNIQTENMIQALLHARKKMSGPSTEVTKGLDGQLSLFETAQELARELADEQKKITVPAYTRTPRQPGVRAEMLSGLVQEIEEYIIPETDTCTKCDSELKIVGKRIVRTEVEFVPAKLKVKQTVQQVAKCSKCGTDESAYDRSHFQKAAVPIPPSAHSIPTPSLIARVMYQKFVMGMPFARQEKDWYRMGLVLPRADMANWTIRCCGEWLIPVYDRIHEMLLECQVLHMDETRIQCNKEEGKKASSESFMWVIRSAECEEITAAYFYYSRSRSGEIARQLLDGFCGYLITDAYSGYGTVDDIIRVLCWAHCRRYYIESILLDNNGKEIPGSKGAAGREYINCYTLRDALRFFSAAGLCKKELGKLFPQISTHSEDPVPSCFSAEEIKKILSSVDRSTGIGKRDYVVLLLASFLGIRAGDIRDLKISSIKWAAGNIEFIQSRTNRFLQLPLLPEIKFAILDYIKNGRPKIDSDHLFLKHSAPYTPLNEHNAFYWTVKSFIKKNNPFKPFYGIL